MSSKLFVGNLSFKTDENGLKELFGQYGEVVSVKIVTDRETGKSRGFGFVEMADQDGAASAVSSLNGADHLGRNIKVDHAQEKPRTGGGGGFGGGPRRPGGGGNRGGNGGFRSRD